MNWADRYLVIDTETTGLHPTGGGQPEEITRVVELGAVLFEKGNVIERANWLICPDRPIPDKVSKIHGVTDEMVRDAPRFAEVVPEILDMAQGAAPVAYNAPFDKRFVHTEVRWAYHHRTALEPLPAPLDRMPWIDPLIWARKLMKGSSNHKLTTVAKAIGIDLSNAHQAEADAEATGRVLWSLRQHLPGDADELLDRQQEVLHGQMRAKFVEQGAKRAGRTNYRRGGNVATYECDACFAVEYGTLDDKGKWSWPARWAKFKPREVEPYVSCSVGCELLLGWWDGQIIESNVA